MTADEERERIRERKREELLERHAGGHANPDESVDGATSPSEPIEIEGEDHLRRVLAGNDVVLVDCYAEWCGPCKMMEPAIDGVAADTDAAVAKVDIDRNQGLARQLGARSVPTLVVFAGGEPVDRQVGAQSRAALEALVERAA